MRKQYVHQLHTWQYQQRKASERPFNEFLLTFIFNDLNLLNKEESRRQNNRSGKSIWKNIQDPDYTRLL